MGGRSSSPPPEWNASIDWHPRRHHWYTPPSWPQSGWQAEAQKAGWVPDWKATAQTAGWAETPAGGSAPSTVPASAMAAPSMTTSTSLTPVTPPPPPPPPEANTDVMSSNNLSAMFLPQSYSTSKTFGAYLPSAQPQAAKTMAATPLTRATTPQMQATPQAGRSAATLSTNSVPYTPNTGSVNPAATAIQYQNQPAGPKNQFQVPSAQLTFGGY